MGTLASRSIDLKSLKVAGEANKYITAIDENGVKVHAANNINLNYTQITSEGMEIFKTNGATSNPSAISVAKFGQTSIIGRQDQSHIKIVNNGLSILNSGITLFDLLLDENQQAKLQHEYDFGETVFIPAGPGPYDLESYVTEYPIITVDNTTFSTDMEFKELENAIDSFTISGYIYNYNLDGTRTKFNVQFDVATTSTKTIGQEYVLKPGHEEETPTEQNTILITIYGRHVANSNSITFYTDSNNELPSSIDLLLLYNLKCYKTTGLPVLTLGLKHRSHVEIDYHSLKLKDEEGNTYLIVQDFKDENGNAVNTIKWTGDSNYIEVPTAAVRNNGIIKVTINGNEVDFYYLNNYFIGITNVEDAPEVGDIIQIYYNAQSIFKNLTKSFTFGTRKIDDDGDGLMSVSFGIDNIVSNIGATAIGEKCIANGDYSLAVGGECKATSTNSIAMGLKCTASGPQAIAMGASCTASGYYGSVAMGHQCIASRAQQIAIGHYNDNKTNTAFEIGNGTSDTARSNALTVEWSGNVDIASGAKYKIGGTALSASDVGAISDVQLNGTSIKSGTVANLLTSSLIDIFYPVGSYYDTSDSSFDPNTSLGGIWSSEEILDDEIVEQGTDSIWTYRKWKSGIAECWGRRDITISLTNNYGGAYYNTDAVGFPTNLFSAEPTVSISRQGRQGTGLVHISPYSVSSTQIQYFITNTNSRYDSASIGIAINARGLWKTYSAPTTKYRWHRTA